MKQPLGTALVAGLVALALAKGAEEHQSERSPSRLVTAFGSGRLIAPHASYVVQANGARVTARTADGGRAVPLDFDLLVDGEPYALTLAHLEELPQGGGIRASVVVDLSDGKLVGQLQFRVDDTTEGLIAELVVDDETRATVHELCLRASFGVGDDVVFVSGVGEVADLAEESGRAVVLDDGPKAPTPRKTESGGGARTPREPHPFGVTSALGEITVRVSGAGDEEHDHDHHDDSDHDDSDHDHSDHDPAQDESGPESSPSSLHATGPLRVAVASPALRPDWGRVDLRLAIGASGGRFWGALFKLAGTPTARLHGFVAGVEHEPAQVFGLDVQGAPQVRTMADENGRFDVEVPRTVTEWYAALDPARTSPPVTFEPGLPWDLRLDVSPGGDLRVRIVDPDTNLPLTARLVVHGIDGTLDPSFGPDYRASGAGPVIDALRGDVATPLPAGRYRVAATRGIEWSIDAKTVDVISGHAVSVELAPRHVVPTPDTIGCDLHVHARPSFDTPVSVEDRVLSLAAAGVDFAVPTEHNIVGDYGPAVESLDLARELAHVHGVEVTTYSPRLGHFGVFPYPLGQKVPPYRHATIPSLFNAAHRGDPNRIVQVNHPRLPKGIGYFEIVGFDPKSGRTPARMRTDFDTLEVYNGYDLGSPSRVDAVLGDWFALLNQGHRYVATGSSDSHRIQYQWAGYPRTMVSVAHGTSGDGAATAIDTLAVVARLKGGHAFVTSGPIVELDVDGKEPGDTVALAPADTTLPVHLVVRAAPWIDVTSFDVVIDGKVMRTEAIPSRPTRLGPELGTREEAAARTVRWEGTLEVPLAAAAHWLVVVARGTRTIDDVLPFMPVAPMALTNPVWIVRTQGAAGADGAQR